MAIILRHKSTIYGLTTDLSNLATGKVAKAGDSMDSNADLTFVGGGEVLGLPATPSVDGAASSKKYVDDQIATRVAKAGSTMDSNADITFAGGGEVLGLPASPSGDTAAASKKYVDDRDVLQLDLAGGTMSGNIVMGSNKVTSTATPTTDDDLARKGYVDDQDDLKLNLTGGTLTGNLDVGTNEVFSSATPSTVNSLVNKAYADSIASGFDPKESVRVATQVNVPGYSASVITIANNNATYFPSAGAAKIDGITLAVGNRVLVKAQTDAKQNGIYVVTTAGVQGTTAAVLTRSEDQNGTPAAEVSAGNTTYVEAGTTDASSTWVVLGDGILTIDTHNIVWTQTSGAGAYSALQGEIDAIETAVGLSTSGGFVSFTGTNYINGATSIANAETLLDSQIKTVADADALKVAKAGSTMDASANITFNGGEVLGLPASPSVDGAAASKKYVDDQAALKLSLTGGTMTGDISMGANQITTTVNPVTNDELTRKGYVDAAITAGGARPVMENLTVGSGANTNKVTLTYTPKDGIPGIMNFGTVRYFDSVTGTSYDAPVSALTGKVATISVNTTGEWDTFSVQVQYLTVEPAA